MAQSLIIARDFRLASSLVNKFTNTFNLFRATPIVAAELLFVVINLMGCVQRVIIIILSLTLDTASASVLVLVLVSTAVEVISSGFLRLTMHQTQHYIIKKNNNNNILESRLTTEVIS